MAGGAGEPLVSTGWQVVIGPVAILASRRADDACRPVAHAQSGDVGLARDEALHEQLALLCYFMRLVCDSQRVPRRLSIYHKSLPPARFENTHVVDIEGNDPDPTEVQW